MIQIDINKKLPIKQAIIIVVVLLTIIILGGIFKTNLNGYSIVQSQCIDSDGGRNYNVKGQVYSTMGPYAPESGEDGCLNSNYQFVETGGVYLSEVFCDENNMFKSEVIQCQNECNNGACISITEPSQTTSPIINSSRICTDSDNGLNYNTEGTLTYQLENREYTLSDHCLSDSRLAEYYCRDNRPAVKLQICKKEEICSNGACTSTIPITNQLKSNFFRNDNAVQSIVNGQPYQLTRESLYTHDNRINYASFEFKLVNAFKQLGYGLLYSPTSVLHSFQRKYSLQESDLVDKNLIFLIDKELYDMELDDKEKAIRYPPYPKFMEGPKEEPSKEHLAKIYYNLLNSFPAGMEKYIEENRLRYPYQLTLSSILSMDSFILIIQHLAQSGSLLQGDSLVQLDQDDVRSMIENQDYNFKYCAESYYAQADAANKCKSTRILYFGGISYDISMVAGVAHEYGHEVGRHIVILNDHSTELHLIFGHISFDYSEEPEYYNNPYLRSNNDGEFVSLYAQTNPYEDFADSFNAYINTGKIFRERAESNIYLQQKYDFLKERIFNGREYDTGSIESLRWWEANRRGIPGDPTGYMQEDPNWVWDYEYPYRDPS